MSKNQNTCESTNKQSTEQLTQNLDFWKRLIEKDLDLQNSNDLGYNSLGQLVDQSLLQTQLTNNITSFFNLTYWEDWGFV